MQSGKPQSERADGEDRPGTWDAATAAADLHLARGTAPEALDAARRAMELAPTPAERAVSALVAGRAMLLIGPEAEARAFLLDEADASATSGADPGTAALMLSHAAASAALAGQVSQALASAERAAVLAAAANERVDVLTRTTLAAVLIAASQTRRGREMLPPPEEIMRVADPAADSRLLSSTAGVALVWAEDLDRAAELMAALEQANRQSGTDSVLPSVLTAMALLAHRRCRWHEAEAQATEALLLARRAAHSTIEPVAAAVLATVEAALGRAVSCRTRALSLLDSPAGAVPVPRAGALSALGLLELGEGRLEAAAHWFEVLAASLPGVERPSPGVVMWEADLAEAYIGLGRREEAQRTLERLEARSQMARSGRASAAVVRCRASLAADDSEAEALFAEALSLYRGETWRFARARTVLALAERRLRSGRFEEARQALHEAGAEFDRIGAAGWSRRVVELLARMVHERAAGPHQGQPLSPAEAQVAMAAGLGADIPAIASGLFISEAEVSAHLRSALDKLGLDDPASVDLVPLVQRLTAGRQPGGDPASAPPAPLHRSDGEPAVTVRMLGGFSIEADGHPVAAGDGITAQAVKAVALAGKIPVEELIDRLWPDSDAEVGRTRLRSLLARVRRQLGPVLERRGSWVALADHVAVDVEVFERHAQEAQVAAAAGDERAGELADAAADLYTGELLPTDRHLDFTAGPRERLRRRYLAVVEVATDHACRRQLLETAVRRLEGAIAADPYDEHLYVRAAGILAGAGRTSEALSMIRRAEAALDELGMTLGPEAAELRAALRHHDA